jgi:exopolysaccharide production protein ExoY
MNAWVDFGTSSPSVSKDSAKIAKRAPRSFFRAVLESERIIRALDLTISITLLVILAPLLVLLAIAVYVNDPGPIIFAHSRVGRNGTMFKVLKFRSMVKDAQARLQHLLATDAEARASWAAEHKLRNDPRITRFGHFLRKSSLDELPQLINVLRGEMSLVGPRPISPEEAVRYGRYFDLYCSVKPGVTGLWQVCGRNDVSYRRRVALDVSFTRNNTVPLYFAILARTAPAALLARGSY